MGCWLLFLLLVFLRGLLFLSLFIFLLSESDLLSLGLIQKIFEILLRVLDERIVANEDLAILLVDELNSLLLI